MRLREISIKNFRCLQDVVIPIDDTSVLVGENNSGKTALLDALKILLPRNQAGRGKPFDEYDYYMSKVGDSPQTSDGIVIELWFREDKSDEWPEDLGNSLNEIIQTDPINDLDSIGLRASSKFDPISKVINNNWEFLDLNGEPLGGKGKSQSNLPKFHSYIRLFYLSALRDSDNEFSSRSQYWGRILRDIDISEDQRKSINEDLTKLNDELLKADPRFEQVRTVLSNIQKVITLGNEQNTSIQALPLNHWDLMSKSEVVIKARGSELNFPISRHGQGIQSLSVLFLFQSFIEVFLKPSFYPETEAILALEEPEAHLHPQATRALSKNLNELKSQKIISSHSPYFIQEIPFTQLRLFRKNGSASKVFYIKRKFSTKLPQSEELSKFCKNHATKYDYQSVISKLNVKGKMEQKEYRSLLQIYPEQKDVHDQIKKLYNESQHFISDDELNDLNTYAKRVRGEILFACAWLLCEGQSEYLLIHYFADLLGKPLDQFGISVIDFQNNGSPGAFVGLAQNFEIPWIMFCDNDEGGLKFLKQVEGYGITTEEIKKLVLPIPEEKSDLEMFLIKNGFMQDYLEILSKHKISLTIDQTDPEFYNMLASEIKKDKIGYMNELIEKLRENKINSSRIPVFFSNIISDIVSKAAPSCVQ